jgi:hypothetical protein
MHHLFLLKYLRNRFAGPAGRANGRSINSPIPYSTLFPVTNALFKVRYKIEGAAMACNAVQCTNLRFSHHHHMILDFVQLTPLTPLPNSHVRARADGA